VASDPTARVRKIIKEVARDRALTDAEIRIFWAGCEKLGWPFGPMFKLLLLTAQRRDEVGRMEWTEIGSHEKRVWTIPREKAKNDRAHEVHLSELAIEIIEELPKVSRQRADGSGLEPSPFVFTTNGERPVSGFSKAKARLDENMVQLLRAELEEAGTDPEKAKKRAGSFTTSGEPPRLAWPGSTSRRTSSTESSTTSRGRSGVWLPSTTVTPTSRSGRRRSKPGGGMSKASSGQRR
jgi:hypothetical protein